MTYTNILRRKKPGVGFGSATIGLQRSATKKLAQIGNLCEFLFRLHPRIQKLAGLRDVDAPLPKLGSHFQVGFGQPSHFEQVTHKPHLQWPIAVNRHR